MTSLQGVFAEDQIRGAVEDICDYLGISLDESSDGITDIIDNALGEAVRAFNRME
jgi:hypothetical protein